MPYYAKFQIHTEIEGMVEGSLPYPSPGFNDYQPVANLISSVSHLFLLFPYYFKANSKRHIISLINISIRILEKNKNCADKRNTIMSKNKSVIIT